MSEQEQENTKKTMTSALPPGRELDAKVAEAVGYGNVGWHYPNRPPYCNCKNLMYSTFDKPVGYDEWQEVPHYSTSIAAAWQLFEGLQGKYICGIAWMPRPGAGPMSWVATIIHKDVILRPRFECWADTAPHAICLAYLALKESEGSRE